MHDASIRSGHIIVFTLSPAGSKCFSSLLKDERAPWTNLLVKLYNYTIYFMDPRRRVHENIVLRAFDVYL